jgi:GT2 family glycosyltransferase
MRGPAERPADGAGQPAPARTLLVVVLNYNGARDTFACLESLLAQAVPGMAVLVVDNGSAGDEAAQITSHIASHIDARCPAVETLALGENRGWAGGNNVGLRLGLERGFEHVCLLNNDTVLAPGALAELLAGAAAVAEATGVPGLLHPVIHYADDPARAQLDPGPAPAGADAPARLLAERHEVVEFGWAYGACLLLPAALVRRVGLLDERFFLQLEEQDYFCRARALGMRSYCARRARILHKESASFGARISATKTYYVVRNSLLLAEKHEGGALGAARALRRLAWTLRHQSRADSASRFLRWLCSADALARAARQGLGDYLRRRFGARPAA